MQLTEEQLKKVLPASLKKTINQELIDKMNHTISNLPSTEFAESYRDNILGYVNVLQDGRFKVQNYLDAVRYCTFKLGGDSNLQAYIKTFPDRYQEHVASNTTEKDINSYVARYNKTKLVTLIMEQSMVPTHILNADIHQKAINHLAGLMVTAGSEKVQCDAANALLTHLKTPETNKIELDIGVKEDKTMDALRQATMDLAAQQRSMLQSGMSNAKEIAESAIIQGEVEEKVIN